MNYYAGIYSSAWICLSILSHIFDWLCILRFSFEQKQFPLNFEFTFLSNFSMTADYEADGHILVLPIKGNGKAIINASK